MTMELWTAFILGLVGSVHCAGMCGPLALALPAMGHRTARLVIGRLAYHTGRIVTYCVLGALFGLAGKALWLAGVQRWASISLGIALLTGLCASPKLALWRPLTAGVERVKSGMSFLLRRRSFSALLVLGLLNGLLPCGLVYVACAAATATASGWRGMLYMTCFGLGTAPMLLALALGGRLIPLQLRLQWRRLIPVSVLLLAGLLILRGMSLGIPYVSPTLDATSPSCCRSSGSAMGQP